MNRLLSKNLLVIAGAAALAACSGADQRTDDDTSERTAEVAQSVVTDCEYLDPNGPHWVPNIDFDRELVIRDLSVVEDPCRTEWSPTVSCNPGSVGAWTFGQLMADMAGNVPVEKFVGEWLNTFETTQVINGWTVHPRPYIRERLIGPWLEASGCPADAPIVGDDACKLIMEYAPFRLLAIVNRIDLSGPASYGGPSPGEGRFVFGTYDMESLEPHEATFIFEYQLHGNINTFEWAALWHDLTNYSLGTEEYNTRLQEITELFTKPGFHSESELNFRSSIGTVRTNEVSFGDKWWELREFTLQDIGYGPDDALLLGHTVAQTPDDSLNMTVDLDKWLVLEEPNILAVNHLVTDTFPWGSDFLGGASSAPFMWDNGGHYGPIDPEARWLFGFGTCNGCHSVEVNANFTHIHPRPQGVPSGLSDFLGVSPAPSGVDGFPATYQSFSDPAGSGWVFDYNEPWRRSCEMSRLLNGDPNPYTKANGAH